MDPSPIASHPAIERSSGLIVYHDVTGSIIWGFGSLVLLLSTLCTWVSGYPWMVFLIRGFVEAWVRLGEKVVEIEKEV